MHFLVFADEADLDAPLGGKARALAALRAARLPIPPWFAVQPAAFTASLSESQRSAFESAADGAALRALVEQVTPSPEVCRELEEALARLCPDGARVAVRSSASDEDGPQHSFAGQLDSFLFVAPPDVPAKVAAVGRPAFSQRIVASRK